jgi:hypothetical protein
LYKIFTVFVASTFAFAVPPIKSNDPFIPTSGMFEINIGSQLVNAQNAQIQAPVLDVNYGYNNFEFTLKSSYLYDNNYYAEGVEFEFKWLFFQSKTVAVAIQPKYLSPSLDARAAGVSELGIGIPINILFGKSVNWGSNLSVVAPDKTESLMEFGTFLRYTHKQHNYIIESFFEEQIDTLKVVTTITLGYTYSIDSNRTLFFSVGREYNGDIFSTNVAFLGIQIIL